MDEFDELSVRRRITRFRHPDEVEDTDDILVKESLLRIVVNDRELAVATLLPEMQREFVHGFLLTNGLISAAEDVQAWDFDPARGVAFIEIDKTAYLSDVASPPIMLGSACGTGMPVSTQWLRPLAASSRFALHAINDAARSLLAGSALFKETGGVHSVALCGLDGSIILRADDIGRHNALDKVAGACLLHGGIDPADCFAMCTGRLSGEIVIKAWRFGLPVLASRSCATSRAVEIACDASIALVGFARGNRLNVYCGQDRIEWGKS